MFCMHAQVCQTLDPLPNKRYIFMKLTYTPDTPAEYEPTGFRAYDGAHLDHFPKRPFMMCAAPCMASFFSAVYCMSGFKVAACMQKTLPCMQLRVDR